MKVSKTERDEQIEKLRKWFPKGSTVYTILRHVSRSGMQRQISVVALSYDGTVYETDKSPVQKIIDLHPNYSVSQILGYRLNSNWHDSLTVNGCGVDMGFEIAYNLARALYGDGYALSHRWL